MSSLPDDISVLISGIKSHFDEDRCLHARDDLVKCRAIAAATGCSEALEEYLQADEHMRVIVAHIQLLNEALDLVRNDSSGACLWMQSFSIFDDCSRCSSSSQAGSCFTMANQAHER